MRRASVRLRHFANRHTNVSLSYRSAVAYTRRPELYDLEYSFKDYEGECARIDEIARGHSPSARTLLDVACGTGKHLACLRTRFDCEGVDLDPGLLGVARERLGDVPLHEGDMRTLDLGRRFDVVTCLFSSIGFVRDLDGLVAAARALAAHVADRGVLIVEPWLTPGVWQPGRPHVLAADTEGLALARVTVAGQQGTISTTAMYYTVGMPDGVEQWREDHELGLFTHDEMRAALEATGLTVEHDPEGLTGRGLWLGTRS
jgi:SAM-dependent methyltransferase